MVFQMAMHGCTIMEITVAFIVFIVSGRTTEQTSWDVKVRENLYFNWVHQLEGSYLKIYFT